MTTTEIKERPILFSGEMVRAILDGRKTMTRRVMKPQLELDTGNRIWWKGDWDTGGGPRAGVCTHGSPGSSEPTWTLNEITGHCPYGRPGDRLWVRETHSLWFDNDGPCKVRGYRADIPPESWDGFGCDDPWWLDTKWRPSIHMPRWASRITLEMTNVRVERVQEISEEDARAEGIEPLYRRVNERFNGPVGNLKPGFHSLWDSLNAKRGYSWESNPWVWVVEFKRVAQGE